MERFRPILTALLLAGCAGDTRLLVTVENQSVVPASLRITQGSLHEPPSLLSVGNRTFPLKVRFYDLHASPVVVLAEGLNAAGDVVSHGAVKASLSTGEESAAELALSDGPNLDTDGDGVPDPVDDCPTISGPCTPDLGGTMPAGKSSCDGRPWLLCEGFDAPTLDPAWSAKEMGTGVGALDSIHPARGTGELHLRLDAPPLSTDGPISSAVKRIRSFTPADKIYVRLFAYLTSATAESALTGIIDLTNTNAGDDFIYAVMGMWRTGQVSSANNTSTQFVPTDRWTCLVWTIESGAAAGGNQHLYLDVDGTRVLDVAVPDNLGPPSLVELALTADQMPGEVARDLWLDDLVVSSTPVGCSD